MRTASLRPLVATISLGLAAPALAGLPADFRVDTMADTVDAAIGDGMCADAAGDCSLRAAVQEANAQGGTQVIALAAGGWYPLTAMGVDEDLASTGDLDITARIHLQGMGATIEPMGDRAFDVTSMGALIADHLTITGGHVVDASGGAIRSAGMVRLSDSMVTDSVAEGTGASGGGLFNDGGYLEVRCTTITGCSADRAGGAIEANAGITVVASSEMRRNDAGDAPGNGGALHLTGMGTVDVIDGVVADNTASREGGGLWNSSTGTLRVDGTEIRDNDALGTAADDGGGGVFNDGGYLSITDAYIHHNTAIQGSGSGGGLFNLGGTMQVARTRVEDNRSTRAGGGIEASAGYTAIRASRVSANATGASPGNGGGLHLTGVGDVLVVGSIFSDNLASAEGGGLWNSAGGVMHVLDTQVRRNTAQGDGADQGGGGLFNDGGELVVQGGTVRLNHATGASGSGGGILNDRGVLDVSGTVVTANTSMRAGGGIEANVGVTMLTEVTLRHNHTGASPGNGGAFHLTGAGDVQIDACTVEQNSAANEGGALWNSSTGMLTVTDSWVRDNSAPINPDNHNDGGSFWFDDVSIP
jgi:CSLREA domain-containing protein